MPENKICPLNANSPNFKCICERCAWFDEDAQACAMLVLAKSMKKVTKNAR